jgi:hypothetical protein
LENSIKERIKRLLNTTVTDVTPIDDLDAQLGTPELELLEQTQELERAQELEQEQEQTQDE